MPYELHTQSFVPVVFFYAAPSHVETSFKDGASVHNYIRPDWSPCRVNQAGQCSRFNTADPATPTQQF